MAKNKTDYMPVVVGAAAIGALIYYLSKQGKLPDPGTIFQNLPQISIPSMPQFSMPSMPQFSMPALGWPEGGLPGCQGLSMPDLSNLLDGLNLGLPDLGLPDLDLGLPDLDLGLPDLGLPDLDLGGGTWNPLGFLPDIRVELPSISFPGLPGLPSLDFLALPETSTWLDYFLKVVFLPATLINPMLGAALTKTVEYGVAGFDAPVSGDGVSPTSSRTSKTPFFIPGPVGADSSPVPTVIVPDPDPAPAPPPPRGGVGAPRRDLPFIT